MENREGKRADEEEDGNERECIDNCSFCTKEDNFVGHLELEDDDDDVVSFFWAEIRKPIIDSTLSVFRALKMVGTFGEKIGMGTREVYEEKLRRGNLDYDPTMNPGLGAARCPRCLSLLNPNSEKGEWTITSVLHDAAAVAGSGIGGLLSAVHAFNTGIPYLQNRFPGSKRLSFLVGVPLLLGYSGLGAAFGGYALPNFAQLTVTSYYASSSASHYGISMLTRHIEEAHLSRTQKEEVSRHLAREMFLPGVGYKQP